MSTTTYQTTAKPRGRKDLEHTDQDSSSRTSSQASQRLSKTTSRTLDELITPTRSRPHSPALFMQRNKPIDPPSTGEAVMTSHRSNVIDDSATRPDLSLTSRSASSPGKTSLPGAFPTNDDGYEQTRAPLSSTLSRVMSHIQPRSRRPSSTSRRQSINQSTIARLQPTVVDASEDETSRTARSSATSLELKSAPTSDLGINQNLKSSTPPPQPTHSPPKAPPTGSSRNVTEQAATSIPKRSPQQHAVDAPVMAHLQHTYYPPPSSYNMASPRQHAMDLTQELSYQMPSPMASPPQSPALVHQTVYSNPSPMPYHYGYPPQTNYGHAPLGTQYHEQQALATPPPTSTFPEAPRSMAVAPIDESQKDWAKLTTVLPELNRLMAKYQDQKGQSATKESFAKQMDFQRTQEMARLRVELDANKTEYEKVIQKLVTESYTFKRDVEQRDEIVKKMQAEINGLKAEKGDFEIATVKNKDSSTRHDKLRQDHEVLAKEYQQTAEELRALKSAHEKLQKKHEDAVTDVKYYRNECSSWKSRYQEAANASDQARLAKEDLVSTKMRLEGGMEELRRKHQAREDKHQSELKNVRKEHEALLDARDKERSSINNEHKAAVAAVHFELAGLMDKYSRQKKDLEEFRTYISNLEKKLDNKSKEREEQSARHRQQIDAKKKELDEQAASHRQQLEAQLSSITSQQQKELDTLKQQHQSDVRSLQRDHESRHARLKDDHSAELKKVSNELALQKQAFESHTMEKDSMRARQSELTAAMKSWKRRQEEWQVEQDKLSKIMEALNVPSMHGAEEESKR